MSKRSSSPHPTRCNGHHRVALVEPLSARLLHLRIARRYSVYELATAAGIFAATIKCLEAGKPADKRVLPALARALGMPLTEERSSASLPTYVVQDGATAKTIYDAGGDWNPPGMDAAFKKLWGV